MKFLAKVKKGVEIIGNIKSVNGVLEVNDVSICEQLKNLGYEIIQEEIETQVDIEKEIPLVEVPIVGTVSAEAPKKRKKSK